MIRRARVAAAMLLAFVWVAAAGAAEEPRDGARLPFRYDPGQARDPFIALVRDGRIIGGIQNGPADMAKPVLFGILWDTGGRSLALINDTEVKVGDTVGPYRVMEIRPDAVVLSDGGEPLVLTIAFDTPPPKHQEP